MNKNILIFLLLAFFLMITNFIHADRDSTSISLMDKYGNPQGNLVVTTLANQTNLKKYLKADINLFKISNLGILQTSKK